MRKTNYWISFLFFLTLTITTFNGISSVNLITAPTTETINVLLLMDNDWGGNCPHIIEIFESYGWNLTIAGPSESLIGCDYVSSASRGTDILISEINDITVYDCISILPGESHEFLLTDQDTLDLIQAAIAEDLIVSAWCRAVRVLAKADVINGKNVTGHTDYKVEYETAGATFFDGVPPIIDGNIVTTKRSRFYRVEMCEAIATALGVYETNSPVISDTSISPLTGDLDVEFEFSTKITDESPVLFVHAKIYKLSETDERISSQPFLSIELTDPDKDGTYYVSKTLEGPYGKYAVDIVASDVFYNEITQTDAAIIEIYEQEETTQATPGWTFSIFILAICTTIFVIKVKRIEKRLPSK